MDSAYPGDRSLIERTKIEQQFGEDYFQRTGVRWSGYFGPFGIPVNDTNLGPRGPPVLNMLPAHNIGDIHKVTSNNTYW